MGAHHTRVILHLANANKKAYKESMLLCLISRHLPFPKITASMHHKKALWP